MFDSGMREGEISFSRLKLEDIRHETALALFSFIYTDKVMVHPAIAVDLLSCADEYLLPSLRSKCEKVIKATIDAENVACHLKAADLHSASELKDACMAYIVKNFEAVSCSDSFMDLGKDLMREIFLAYARRDGPSQVCAL